MKLMAIGDPTQEDIGFFLLPYIYVAENGDAHV